MISLGQLLRTVREHDPAADLDLVRRAYAFAEGVHEGQRRKSGEPYFSHPAAVAKIVADLRQDATVVAAALLHDTVEDTGTTIEEILQEFGRAVARIVEGMTKLEGVSFQGRLEKEAENFRRMLVAMSGDPRVILVKLADRLHNMLTLGHLDPAKQREIARETLEIYAPLAHRLGIHSIKVQLEDEALRYLHPEIYEQLKRDVSKKRAEREKYVREFCEALRQKLEAAGIDAEVKGRPKHFYSIYQKMRRQNVLYDQICDIGGFRILVDQRDTCYLALGVVHANWKPVPGRFKDYIAMPKANGYQSLHTTIIGDNGERVEVQIRTHDMHEVAEMGVAAHWRYREGPHVREDEVDRFSWLRRLLEAGGSVRDPLEFMATVRDNLFADEVFVFTPRGDLVKLPKGSTVVDFAYHVHTEVGHHCAGARVNGRIVPLRYRLRDGESVEIITRASQTPSRDWLGFVRTSRARSRIRAWLRREQQKRSREIGRQLLEKDLARHGLRYGRLREEGKIRAVAEALSVGDVDTLEAAVGYGKITTGQVLGKLVPLEELHKEKREGALRRWMRRLSRESAPQIRVAGIDDVLVRIAGCCSPLPGQQILGFVSPGRGVTIHSADCPRVLDVDPQRRVDVEWSEAAHAPRAVPLDVISVDRPGMLSAITRAIGNFGVNITRADVRTRPDGTALNRFDVVVASAQQLNEVMRALGRVRGVLRVARRSEHETAAP